MHQDLTGPQAILFAANQKGMHLRLPSPLESMTCVMRIMSAYIYLFCYQPPPTHSSTCKRAGNVK